MKRFNTFDALVAVAISLTAAGAVAQSLADTDLSVLHTGGGGHGFRGGLSRQGSHAAFDGQRGLFLDGKGNAAGASSGSFNTAAGGEGQRTRLFKRSVDGGLSADGQASASGSHGSAQRSGSLNLTGDGSGNAQRNTTLTNSHTGNTFDASASFSRGSGLRHSATCQDSAGNSVGCGPR